MPLISKIKQQEMGITAQSASTGIVPVSVPAVAKIEPTTKVTIDSMQGLFVTISRNDNREDVTNLLMSIPTIRMTTGDNKKAIIPIAELKRFREMLLQLPNTEMRIINKELKDAITYQLDTPPWTIDIKERWLICKWGPGADRYLLYTIPGVKYETEKKYCMVPLTEAHALFERLQKVGEGSAVWSEEAQKFVIEQITRRSKLDEIALKTVSDIYKGYEAGGVTLRDFQTVGAEFLEVADGKALIADEMGLGKTYQVLFYFHKNRDIIKKKIIICQAALKPKWIREIKRIFGDDVKYYAPSSSVPKDLDFIALFQGNIEFVVINYDLLGEFTKGVQKGVNEKGYETQKNMEAYLWVKLLNVWKPDATAVDESHYAKNIDAHRTKAILQLKCPRFICMTGTPVLNRPAELFTTLHLLDPDQFPAYETFINQYTYDGKRARNVEELRNVLKPIMIRRLKKDVMKDLPPINRIKEWHTLSDKAKKLYEKVLQGVYNAIADYNPSGHGGYDTQVTHILAQITRLKQICASSKVDQTVDLAYNLYDQTDESEYRKVLIFTQFKPICYRIAAALEKDRHSLSFVERTPTEFVTVDNKERDRRVQQFQEDPNIRFLVVTEKTAKEGHNITAAGHVIFNDLFWTPAAHAQAEGRAYGRMDNPHPINSYWMITDLGGEGIEEWIMELLEKKLNVINETVEGLNEDRDISIQDDLIARLRNSMYIQRKGRR